MAELGRGSTYTGTSAPDECGCFWLDGNTSPPTLKVQTAATGSGTGPAAVTVGSATPTAHNTSHQSGGSDPIKLDDLAAPDDNTDLDVSNAKHGLTPKGPSDSTKFLRGDATPTWAVPECVTSFSFVITNPSAGISNTEIISAGGGAGSYHTMPVAATVVGIAWQFTGTHTLGVATFRARKNGAGDSSIQHISGATETKGSTTGTGVSLAANDTLGCELDTEVAWNGTAGVCRVDIWVRVSRF